MFQQKVTLHFQCKIKERTMADETNRLTEKEENNAAEAALCVIAAALIGFAILWPAVRALAKLVLTIGN
jgi:hypothetical protein